MAKFAAVYCIVFGFFILNLIQVNDLLLKVHLSLYSFLHPRDIFWKYVLILIRFAAAKQQ